MPGKKSSGKGKDYERKISRLLSEWCGFELIRTPMSGAWPGTSGDVLPKDRSQYFPFLIECKKCEGWNMEQLLSGNGLFQSWLDQVHEEMERDATFGHPCKSFLLIFSRNNKPNYVAILSMHALPGLVNGYPFLIIPLRQPIVVMELSALIRNHPYQSILSMVEFKPEILSTPSSL